jgi:hypothetical protein
MEIRDARLRSGWEDNYRGAIAAARGGKPKRLVDCLRARKPPNDDDYDLLADFIAQRFGPVGNRRNRAAHQAAVLLRALKPFAPGVKIDDLVDRARQIIEHERGGKISREAVLTLLRNPKRLQEKRPKPLQDKRPKRLQDKRPKRLQDKRFKRLQHK